MSGSSLSVPPLPDSGRNLFNIQRFKGEADLPMAQPGEGSFRRLVGRIVGSLRRWVRAPPTHRYWERRYRRGGTSGAGSYDRLSAFKAEVINGLIEQHKIEVVTEWGCGDGNQLELASYPQYVGYDVSETALRICTERFSDDPTKDFRHASDYVGDSTDAAISLDVVFHLVEDSSFESYMYRLFQSARRLVIVYSSNTDEDPEPRRRRHMKHRQFTAWVSEYQPEWELISHIPNRYPYRGDFREGTIADFFTYRRVAPRN